MLLIRRRQPAGLFTAVSSNFWGLLLTFLLTVVIVFSPDRRALALGRCRPSGRSRGERGLYRDHPRRAVDHHSVHGLDDGAALPAFGITVDRVLRAMIG